MRLSRIALFSVVFTIGFSCANLHADEQDKSKADAALNLLGTVAENALKDAIDRKATLVSMDVVEQDGNSIVVDVSYKRIYKFENTELQAIVLNGGKQLPGFSSTVASIDSESGTARISLKWDNAGHGDAVNSDQVKIYIQRNGDKLKSKVFDYKKEWGDPGNTANNSGQTITPTSNSPSACVNSIQGKVAWDYKNSKTWAKPNLDRLCHGAESSDQPGVCFDQVMHGGVNWGGGTTWQWQNALNLCQGTTNATATVSCFKNEINNKHPWKTAINNCRTTAAKIVASIEPINTVAYNISASRTCYNSIQGKIAWDYKGTNKWVKSNIDKLCKGAESSSQPGVCFNTIMHGGVNWGGGTKWNWQNAINLCQGAKIASSRVSCFQGRIKSGKKWKDAILYCRK